MALEGSFDDMPLADLIVVFQVGRKSGLLAIEGEAARGYVFVSRGRLIDATVQEWPSQCVRCTGDEAVLELLVWRSAQFVFTGDVSVLRRPVTIFRDGAELVRQSQKPIVSNSAYHISASLELDFTDELAEIGNDAFNADLGASLRSGQLASLNPQWQGQPVISNSYTNQHTSAVSQDVRAPWSNLDIAVSSQSAPVQTLPSTGRVLRGNAGKPASRLLQAVMRRVHSL